MQEGEWAVAALASLSRERSTLTRTVRRLLGVRDKIKKLRAEFDLVSAELDTVIEA